MRICPLPPLSWFPKQLKHKCTQKGAFRKIFVSKGCFCPGSYVYIQDTISPFCLSLIMISRLAGMYEMQLVEYFSAQQILHCTSLRSKEIILHWNMLLSAPVVKYESLEEENKISQNNKNVTAWLCSPKNSSKSTWTSVDTKIVNTPQLPLFCYHKNK